MCTSWQLISIALPEQGVTLLLVKLTMVFRALALYASARVQNVHVTSTIQAMTMPGT